MTLTLISTKIRTISVAPAQMPGPYVSNLVLKSPISQADISRSNIRVYDYPHSTQGGKT
jgi:hypothetical protein